MTPNAALYYINRHSNPITLPPSNALSVEQLDPYLDPQRGNPAPSSLSTERVEYIEHVNREPTFMPMTAAVDACFSNVLDTWLLNEFYEYLWLVA